MIQSTLVKACSILYALVMFLELYLELHREKNCASVEEEKKLAICFQTASSINLDNFAPGRPELRLSAENFFSLQLSILSRLQ